MTTLEKFIGRRLEEISAQGPRVKLLKKTSDAAADEVRAKISVTLEGEKRARWRIQVENLTEDAIE